MKEPTGDESRQLDQLERQRKDVDRELTVVKDQLQQAMQTEVFNEKTGVGETKYGLPLGFCNITLMALEGCNIRDQDCIIVISVRSTKGDPSPPGPPPKHSNPATRGKLPALLSLPASGRRTSRRELMPETVEPAEGGLPRLEFNNQSFQLAPIRTTEAEIIFDVLDRHAEQSKVRGPPFPSLPFPGPAWSRLSCLP
jgi:hypothetical protein